MKRGHSLNHDEKVQLQQLLLDVYIHNRKTDKRHYFHSPLSFFFGGYSKAKKESAAKLLADSLKKGDKDLTGASKQGLLGKIARFC